MLTSCCASDATKACSTCPARTDAALVCFYIFDNIPDAVKAASTLFHVAQLTAGRTSASPAGCPGSGSGGDGDAGVVTLGSMVVLSEA